MRINNISGKANNQINEYLELPKGGYYTYFDFDFKPYENAREATSREVDRADIISK